MHAPPPAALAAELLARLEDNAVPGRAAGEKRYLRSDLHHIGVPLPAMRGVVRSFTRRSGQGLGHAELVDLVTDLWAEPVHEHRSTALLLLDAYAPLLRPDDTALLEDLLRTCATWAHTDLLAPFAAGRLLLRHPRQTTPAVLRWTADEAQWVRRCDALRAFGYAPLPVHRPVAERPEDGPYLLTSAHSPFFFNSEFRNLGPLRAKEPDPVVELHPEAAAREGVQDGAWVLVSARGRTVRMRARVTDTIAPDVVVAAATWWYPERGADGGWRESNLNRLTGDDDENEEMGSSNFRGIRCAVRPEPDA
ncbi:DNA alkylation repair protein [Streptomyces canarius]